MATMATFLCSRVTARQARQRAHLGVVVRATPAAARPRLFKLRICTDPTARQCLNAGAQQIVQFVRDLGLEEVEVQERKCLGDCGFGPNMQLIPLDGGMGERLNHISSPSKMAQALKKHCGIEVDEAAVKATEFRLAGNLAARQGDLKKAIHLFTQGLEQQSPIGHHLLLSNRSSMRLAVGDGEGALEDAVAAAECCPPEFTTAVVRQVEALLKLGRREEAGRALAVGAARCPEWGEAQEYQALLKACT